MRNQLTKKYALTEEDFSFMFKNMKLMYFREKGNFKWHKSHLGSHYNYCRGKKRGVLLATRNPFNRDEVIIGWSMCHKKHDKFDKERGIYTALGRALAWADRHRYSSKEHSDSAYPTFVPSSMLSDFVIFVNRITSYYKNCTFPEWSDSPLVRSRAWCFNDYASPAYLEQVAVN